jgi:predicted outer membrane repeat protein
MLKPKKTSITLAVLTLLFCLLAIGTASAADTPTANFTSNVTNGNTPLNVQFNDTSSNTPTNWNWDFGDNTTSTEQNPTHTYTKAGQYNVSLTASNEAGNNSLTQTNYITVLLNDAYISPTGSDTTGDGTNTNPYATIQNGINNLATGGTLHLQNGTYTGTGNYAITINKNITIIGDDQTNTIINAAKAGNIFTINSGITVTINNITLSNATVTTIDGGAILNSGTLSVNNCTFTNNTAKQGGAINNAGTINISDSNFTNNIAKNAGAILNKGTITFLSGCNFSYNSIQGSSSGKGGAIYNAGTIGTINNCNFITNTAIFYGGAICNYDIGKITSVNDCTFTNNTASYGGAFMNYYGAALTSVKNCTFIGNTASTSMGAFWNGVSVATIMSDCTFINNTAPKGGAIGNMGALNVTNCTFTDNIASSYGGAIYSATGRASGVINVYSSSFVNNKASSGGAIYNYIANGAYTATTNVNYSSFINNTATSAGNTICVDSGTVNAANNWWGSNNNPSSQFSGTVTYSNWLYVTLTTDPSTILNGNTATVTVNFNNIWNGTDVVSIDPANGHIPDNTTVTFTSTLGTFNPITATTTNGTTKTTFTATTTGINTINATAGTTPISTNITVYDTPIANFKTNTTNGIAPLNVQFTDTSSNVPTSWSWNFGDGTTSTDENPTHTYNTDGTYTVTLTVSNTAGNNTIIQTNLIKVGNPELVASNLELPSNPVNGTSYTVNTTVTNTGVSDAGSFVVKLYDNNVQVAKTTITGLVSGANTVLNFNWTPNTVGSHILSVIADVNNQINETNRTNNQITQTVTTIASALPELTVSNLQLPTNPINGTTYTVNVTVANTGNGDAGAFVVKLYDNNVQVGKITISGLLTGANTILTFNWTPNTIGTHVLSAIADANKQLTETNRNNNQITQTVNTTASTLPDLTATNLQLPTDPVIGTTYTINVTVANTGASDITSSFAVKLYDNNTQIQKITVNSLAAGASTILTFNWTPTPTGTHNISVIADANKQLTETTRNNNQITQAVTAT